VHTKALKKLHPKKKKVAYFNRIECAYQSAFAQVIRVKTHGLYGVVNYGMKEISVAKYGGQLLRNTKVYARMIVHCERLKYATKKCNEKQKRCSHIKAYYFSAAYLANPNIKPYAAWENMV